MYDKIFEVVQDSHRRMVSVSMIFKIEFDDDGFFCFFWLFFFFLCLKKFIILTHILDFVNVFRLTSNVFSMLTCLIGIFHQWKDGRDVQMGRMSS